MGTVRITAHRGSSAIAPENTLAAFRQAIADRADCIELDVQTCADGHVVVVHDRDFRRVADDPGRVENLTLKEIKRIDVGRRVAHKFIGEHPPTLSETIALARDKMLLNIELKYNRPDTRLVPAVLAILRQETFLDQCVISSLDPTALRAVKAAEPSICTGLIVTAALNRISRVEADFLSLASDQATSQVIRESHQAGKPVHVWTVNDPHRMRSLIEQGADNIITDRPDVLRALLEEP